MGKEQRNLSDEQNQDDKIMSLSSSEEPLCEPKLEQYQNNSAGVESPQIGNKHEPLVVELSADSPSMLSGSTDLNNPALSKNKELLQISSTGGQTDNTTNRQ